MPGGNGEFVLKYSVTTKRARAARYTQRYPQGARPFCLRPGLAHQMVERGFTEILALAHPNAATAKAKIITEEA
jgi:hypothetical protein